MTTCTHTDNETRTTTVTTTKTRHMPMYKVLIHNDDKSTMEFVTTVLMTVFNHQKESAVKVMLNVHEQGIGLAGIYALEHAEMKRDIATSLARAKKYPLHLSIEPDE